MDPPAVDPDAFDAFEAQGWEEKAGGYERFFPPITGRVVEPLLDAAGAGPGTRLLDLATGSGLVAARAAERDVAVVAVDGAEAMVATARRVHPGLDVRRAEVTRLPFEDAAFDAVTGNFVLLHLGRPEAAVAEAARVLRPGGRLAFTVWDLPERARLLGVFLDAVAAARAKPPEDLPTGPDFFRFAHEEAFDALLAGAGLEDRSVRTIAFLQRFTSAEALWSGFLAGTVRTSALIERQPEETRERIRAAFDRLVAPMRRGDALEVPVSVKLGSGARRG